MTRAELLALAERVENAAGPDSRLEEVIEAKFDPTAADECRTAPRYMSSRDAAASLMPPGWHILIECYWTDENTTSWAVNAQKMDGSKRARGYAKDEPRARLAAALRAQAWEAGDE